MTKPVCGVCGALQRRNEDGSYSALEKHYVMCATGQYGFAIDIQEKPEDWLRPTEAEYDEEFANPVWQAWVRIDRNRKTRELKLSSVRTEKPAVIEALRRFATALESHPE